MAVQKNDTKATKTDTDMLDSNDLIDLDGSDVNELSAAQEAQQAAEEAAQASAEAEAIAITEAQAAVDAKAAAEQAIAAAEAAEKAAEEAKVAAQVKAIAETEAAEEAEAALEAAARVKAEEEAKAKAEEEANITSTKESEDFLSNNLDDDEIPAQKDSPDTLSSMEKELGELTDWVEPEKEHAITTDTNSDAQNLATPQQPQQTITATHKEEAMPTPDKSSSGIASSIMLSVALIAMLIAALAIWMSLDTSQKATVLASAPGKLQLQIDRLEQQHLLQQQRIEDLEHQLKNLTKVIANKTTEQWRTAIEKPTLPTTKSAKKITPSIKLKAPTTQEKPISIKPIVVKEEPAATVKETTTATAKPINNKTPNTVKPDQQTSSKPITLSAHEIKPSAVQGWVVYLFSDTSENVAQRVTRQYRAKDIDAKYVRIMSKGKQWHHVLVSGFETERKAAAFKVFLKEYHGIKSWHNKSAREISKPMNREITPIKTSTPAHKKPSLKNTTQKSVSNTSSHRVRFKAVNSDIWLQVFAPNAKGTAKGRLLKDVLLKPNDFTTITSSSQSLWITTGNAPALSISVDGKVITKHGSLGADGKVLRDYRFNINQP